MMEGVLVSYMYELRKKLVKCYIWSTALCGAETWTVRVSRSETAGKF